MKNYQVKEIEYNDTKDYILNIHYARRMPQIKYKFGLYEKGQLVGVVCYGIPASRSLCKGICGPEYQGIVIELNRLVLKNNKKNEASYLVGQSIKLLPKPLIIVSYADTEQNHEGVVYQATNFIYTGLSDKHMEWRMYGSKIHSKNICKNYTLQYRRNNPDKFYTIDRPRKHRYIYFHADKKYKKKVLLPSLRYKIKDYPKKSFTVESFNESVKNYFYTPRKVTVDPGEYDDVCRLRDEILIKENVSVEEATDRAEKKLGVLHK
jgi:hypothetical protein